MLNPVCDKARRGSVSYRGLPLPAGRLPGQQSGAALLVFMIIVVLGGLSLILDDLNKTASSLVRIEERNDYALQTARAALIGWSVSHPSGPGYMPFPDRRESGASTVYDGNSDCVTSGINDNHLLGVLPWKGEVSPCVNWPLNVDARDASGEQLWYAVSKNLVRNGLAGPLNSDLLKSSSDWITVRDANGQVISDRVAIVLIAPGPALETQDRSPPDAATGDLAPDISNYLDVFGAYSNRDYDQDFIMGEPGDTFNDRLVFLTIDELMPLIERRVIAEVRSALATYRTSHLTPGYMAYPWMAPFDNENWQAEAGTREGRLPVHMDTTDTRQPDITLDWNIANVAEDDDSDGNLVKIPATTMNQIKNQAGFVFNVIAPLYGYPSCKVLVADRVECTGTRNIVIDVAYRLDFSFAFTGLTSVVSDPNGSSVRKRQVELTLPDAGAQFRIDITGISTSDKGWVELQPGSTGFIRVKDLDYYLDSDAGEIPDWYVDNEWYRFIYVAVADSFRPGGDNECGNVVDDCLEVDTGFGTLSNQSLVVVSAGQELGGGSPNRPSDQLDDYFERDNDDGDTTLERHQGGSGFPLDDFNDQLQWISCRETPGSVCP